MVVGYVHGLSTYEIKKKTKDKYCIYEAIIEYKPLFSHGGVC